MSSLFFTSLGFFAARALAGTYAVPASPPSNSSSLLDPSPVGVSIEFFTFPDYFNVVNSTHQCLQNLKDVTGTWPPLRIGGTTQDRGTYDEALSSEIQYTVSSSTAAPDSLTFGPAYIDLAAAYPGQVTIGFNRRLNNLNNTMAASTYALQKMQNLYAVELGNEPNFYSSSEPIAGGTWNAAQDRLSQISWQGSVAANLSTDNIIQAGVFFGTGSYSIATLAEEEGTALDTVKSFCSHNYPQGGGSFNLPALMSHSSIATNVAFFKPEIVAAKSAGKDYVMGETNSASQGGGGISPTFGAALWVLDYMLQSVVLGIKTLYFHHGTLGACQYCWWGRYSMGAPYYGAYFAALALADADYVAPLDAQTDNYAAYAIYKNGKPVRAVLYNSDYYNTGVRSNTTFTLTGLSSSSVTAKRLTAASAEARQDQGVLPTVAGQTFKDGTCAIQGTPVTETASVVSGAVSFQLEASEALLVYL